MPLKRIVFTLFIVANMISVCAQTGENAQMDQLGTLPVMFDSVRAVVKGNQVMIGWSNLTEREVSFYLIERSKNGRDFTPVFRLEPLSNLNEKAAYSFVDTDPLDGDNYYRISVAIITGRTVRSRIMKAQIGFSASGFTVYPNPVTDGKINVSLGSVQRGSYVLQLINTAGVQIKQTTLFLQGEGISQPFDFPPGLRPGIYVLAIKGEAYSASKLVVKR